MYYGWKRGIDAWNLGKVSLTKMHAKATQSQIYVGHWNMLEGGYQPWL